MLREDAVPSTFSFATVTATKKLGAEQPEFPEVNWEMKCPALRAALNTIQVVFLKVVKVQALNLQAIAHKMMMRCMSVIASNEQFVMLKNLICCLM